MKTRRLTTRTMLQSTLAAVASCLVMGLAHANDDPQNAGSNQPNPKLPFVQTQIAQFESPWALAFLPDGRLLVTEKAGRVFLVAKNGETQEIGGAPDVYTRGQNGLLDVAVAPEFSDNHTIYFSFVEPTSGGGALALARAQLDDTGNQPVLRSLTIIWRQEAAGRGGHPGGKIAFAPDHQYLFLTVGDRQDTPSAKDPDLARGKVLRLNPDGSTPADNPLVEQGGVKAQTWTSGHRNPYGLAFAPDGKLWAHEMGPRGGDELNLIQKDRNYGWPAVSNGNNYSGIPIPGHSTRPEFQAPALYWDPVVSPAGLAFYKGDMFPDWQGSALIGSLSAKGLLRISFDQQGGAREVDRWSLGQRIRDVAVASDGAIWLIQDGPKGALLRLVPIN